jgi:hypothetical protein
LGRSLPLLDPELTLLTDTYVLLRIDMLELVLRLGYLEISSRPLPRLNDHLLRRVGRVIVEGLAVSGVLLHLLLADPNAGPQLLGHDRLPLDRPVSQVVDVGLLNYH